MIERKCSYCREPGHRRPQCPKAAEDLAELKRGIADLQEQMGDAVAEIAALREQLDALDEEAASFNQVVAHVSTLMLDNRTRSESIKRKIAELRAAR